MLNDLRERGDILQLLFGMLDNHHLLLLSMCCRGLRGAVDGAHARLGRGLFVGNWAREALDVKEYADCIVLRVDCSLSKTTSLANKLMLSLTGLPGEILSMGVQVHGTHTDESFTQEMPVVRFRDWQVEFCNLHSLSTNSRYGRHTLRLRNIDAACHKEVVMYIENIELALHRCRRTLLALRQRYKCMVCNVRAFAYTCPLAADPRLRKVCKRCASELLVSTRMLYREWKVYDKTVWNRLQQLEGRYRGNAGTYAATWMSKHDVAAFFGAPSWPEFIAKTAQRAKCL